MTEKKIIKSRTKSKIKIKVGDKFGRLTVLENVGIIKSKTHFKCECACGSFRTIVGNDLRTGHTKSCGCIKKELLLRRNTKHGLYGTVTHNTWHGMLQRCNNLKADFYQDYGGRGIKVCKRWYKFENFFADMGVKPEGLTIERKDNNLGYFKENCCWASPTIQARNRRISKNNTTGVKGIIWNKKTQKYITSICVNYKRIHLGSHKTLEQAVIARGNGEQKYWI